MPISRLSRLETKKEKRRLEGFNDILLSIAYSPDGKTVIAEGLRPGEDVVTRGGFLLKSQMLRAAMQGE